MYRLLSMAILIFVSPSIHAAPESCGVVKIEKILTGPRHGAMVKIDNTQCGGDNEGWICLDPDAQHMSEAESNRLFSFLLAFHLADKEVAVMIDKSVHTSACSGTYAFMHDARTP